VLILKCCVASQAGRRRWTGGRWSRKKFRESLPPVHCFVRFLPVLVLLRQWARCPQDRSHRPLISYSCAIDLRLEIVGMNRSTMSCLPFIIMEAKSPAAEVGFQSHDTGCTHFQKFRESLPPQFGQSPNSYKPAAKVRLPRFVAIESATSKFSREKFGGFGITMAFQGGEIPRVFALSAAGEVPWMCSQWRIRFGRPLGAAARGRPRVHAVG
jgi:hypothetical protein